MKEKIFIRSYRLVPEIRNPLIKSSLIVLLGTGLRMVGPWLISKGVDEGVVKSDYSYVFVFLQNLRLKNSSPVVVI